MGLERPGLIPGGPLRADRQCNVELLVIGVEVGSDLT
jgi:hypothetical protein